MEDSAKRKRVADVDVQHQDLVAVGEDKGPEVWQVSTMVDWNKVGGRDRKISFQQGIYTIPHLKDVSLQRWHDLTVEGIGDRFDSFTIAKERHSDGEWEHIHCWMKFAKCFTCYPTTFDKVFPEKHGNLAVMKKGNVKKHQFYMLRYVTKGGEFLDWPIDWDCRAWMLENTPASVKHVDSCRKKTKRDDIATKIIEEDYSKPYNIAKEEPGYFMERSKQVQDFMEYVHEAREADKKKNTKWTVLQETKEWGPSWLKVIRWLNFMIRQPSHHIGRPRHLFVHGNTRLGKTTRLINPLKERLHCYMLTKDELQNMPWRDDYDLCIMDDFKGQKSIIWMNEFLGSKNMLMQVPGGTHMRKTRIVPTIVISNFPLARYYPLGANCEDESFNALKDRFIEVELTQQGNSFNVSDADERLANEMMEYILREEEECATKPMEEGAAKHD